MRYVTLLLLLSACQPPPVNDCPVAHHWSKTEWGQIADAKATLPKDSILIPVLKDYIRIGGF